VVPPDLDVSHTDDKNKKSRDRPPYLFSHKLDESSIETIALPLIQFCHQQGYYKRYRDHTEDVFDLAVSYGRVDIVEWGLSLNIAPSNVTICSAVVKYYIDVMELLRAHKILPPDEIYSFSAYVKTDGEYLYLNAWSPPVIDWLQNVAGIVPNIRALITDSRPFAMKFGAG
jgi:hypothetical protein